MFKMYIGLHIRYPLFLSDFNNTLFFTIGIRKILKYQTSRKSAQLEPSSKQTEDRRTDMTKLRVAFRNFAKAPKKTCSYLRCS